LDQEEKDRTAKFHLIQSISTNESILANTKLRKSKLLIEIAKPGNRPQWLSEANARLLEYNEKIIRCTRLKLLSLID